TPPPASPRRALGVARPAERHSPSSVSWAVPWASSQWDVPGKPPEEGVQEASRIDARATLNAPFRMWIASLYYRAPPRMVHSTSLSQPKHPWDRAAEVSTFVPATQSSLHWSLTVSRLQVVGPLGDGPRVSRSGLVPRPVPRVVNPATRSLSDESRPPGLAPGWDPGSAVTRRRSCLDIFVPHEGF
ncbi:hypothetical protein CRENBAI_000603, partial [Crenichthys baileyi]